jgi:hypothetical protein
VRKREPPIPPLPILLPAQLPTPLPPTHRERERKREIQKVKGSLLAPRLSPLHGCGGQQMFLFLPPSTHYNLVLEPQRNNDPPARQGLRSLTRKYHRGYCSVFLLFQWDQGIRRLYSHIFIYLIYRTYQIAVAPRCELCAGDRNGGNGPAHQPRACREPRTESARHETPQHQHQHTRAHARTAHDNRTTAPYTHTQTHILAPSNEANVL